MANATENYSDAIGRIEQNEAEISLERANALAATLDLAETLELGAALPCGWQWLYFNPFVVRSQIGADGHPKRGGFLPNVQLPRRMWAGSRIKYHDALSVGSVVQKQSEIVNVVSKSGRAGELVFVTVSHRHEQDGKLIIEEEQDIVYREAPAADAPKPPLKPAPEGAEHSTEFVPDPVLLFRYSALTYNGHRIHYDRNYAQNEEDYHDLVVHGPLTATLLQGFAGSLYPSKRISEFEFRGVAPLFADRSFHLEAGKLQDNVLPLWARGPEGELAMNALARFA